MALTSPGKLSQSFYNVLRVGVPAFPKLGEHKLAIGADIEYPAATLDQLRRYPHPFFYFLRQTGGAGIIVSDLAEGYRDFHGFTAFICKFRVRITRERGKEGGFETRPYE